MNHLSQMFFLWHKKLIKYFSKFDEIYVNNNNNNNNDDNNNNKNNNGNNNNNLLGRKILLSLG